MSFAAFYFSTTTVSAFYLGFLTKNTVEERRCWGQIKKNVMSRVITTNTPSLH